MTDKTVSVPHRNLARHLAAVRASIVRNGDTTCTLNQDALVHLMNECDILLDKSHQISVPTESREPLPDPRCIVKGHLSRVCELGTKCCVVKHSEWRDNGQGPVPSVPAEIESQPFKPEGDMFWDEADTETSHFDPYDILDEHLAGEIVEFEQAKRLPNFFGFSWGRDEEPKEFYFATKEEAEKKLDELTADSTPTQEKPSGSK